jgi:nucleotide-binding universal stress UspA family protein
VPVDFSVMSKKAFLYALKFAEQFSCEITLLIVVQPMSPMVGAPLAVEAFSETERSLGHARGRVRR